MTTSKCILNFAYFCGILLFVFSACSPAGSGSDTNNNDSTVLVDSGEANVSGSCNNKERPKDELPSATLIKKEESLGLINAFNSKFYGSEIRPEVFSPAGTEGLFAANPSERVGAFISKHMLDALFDRDLSANGIMVYIGHGPAADGSTQMQYIITPAKRTQNNAAPEIPADVTGGIFLKIVDQSWCPTNCDDLR